ncbi:terminase small subunit [Sporosarcina sp. FSL K6-2383]|uniref:terminase small subunit n=1 Tax=Sporosarcina sp. FSL K6-2383 TaxID=2921556 RepID=UPI00315B38C5
MSNWEEIQREWETTKITLAALAEKHDVKLGTLKSRKSRDKWSKDAIKKDATKQPKKDASVKKVATIKEVFVESDDLTDKQRLFCIYYIKYFNATKAYQKAYECDYVSAMSNGNRMIRNDKVSAEIDRMRNEALSEKKISADDILQKYIDIAFADITNFVEFGSEERNELDEDGNVLLDENGKPITYLYSYVNFNESDDVDGTIITEVKKGKDGVSVKLADKMKALEMLAKFTDLLSDGDKKRLQEEKLKADTAKSKAEVHKITNENKQVAPPTITIVDAWSDDDE